MANPGTASCWVWLSRGRGRGKSHWGPQEGEKHQDEQVQVLLPLLSPAPVLEAPPGFWWGELIHISHLIVGLVTHSEDELVAEADLLLLGVSKEQDLGDGGGVDDGVKCWQLCAGGWLQPHLHDLGDS